MRRAIIIAVMVGIADLGVLGFMLMRNQQHAETDQAAIEQEAWRKFATPRTTPRTPGKQILIDSDALAETHVVSVSFRAL